MPLGEVPWGHWVENGTVLTGRALTQVGVRGPWGHGEVWGRGFPVTVDRVWASRATQTLPAVQLTGFIQILQITVDILEEVEQMLAGEFD